jgi:tetratricopeptide (TPR) repeat protein
MNRAWMHWREMLLLVLLMLCPWSPNLLADDRELMLAIEEYQQAMETPGRDERIQRFNRAEQLFEQIISDLQQKGRTPSPALLVNWGNAALQAQHTGVAILAYRRALLAEPGNEQAQQNLAFARSTLPEWARRADTQQLAETLFFWRRLYSIPVILFFAAVAFLIAAVLAAAGIALRRPLWRNLAAIPLFVWLVLMISVWSGSGAATQQLIVVADDTVLYSADSENSAPRLAETLPGGTELSLLQQRGRWTEVRLAGSTGWVRTSAIRSVDRSLADAA